MKNQSQIEFLTLEQWEELGETLGDENLKEYAKREKNRRTAQGRKRSISATNTGFLRIGDSREVQSVSGGQQQIRDGNTQHETSSEIISQLGLGVPTCPSSVLTKQSMI